MVSCESLARLAVRIPSVILHVIQNDPSGVKVNMQPPATLFREQNKTLHTCYDMWQCIASIGPSLKNLSPHNPFT